MQCKILQIWVIHSMRQCSVIGKWRVRHMEDGPHSTHSHRSTKTEDMLGIKTNDFSRVAHSIAMTDTDRAQMTLRNHHGAGVIGHFKRRKLHLHLHRHWPSCYCHSSNERVHQRVSLLCHHHEGHDLDANAHVIGYFLCLLVGCLKHGNSGTYP